MSDSTNPTPTHPTPHAASTQPDLLLRDFLLSPADLFALADAHKLSLDALITWWADPATKARIRALEEIAEARRDIRAKLHAAKAIDRLSALSESTGNDPTERRQCANSILKHSPAARQPRKPDCPPDRATDSDRATGFGASPTPVVEPPTARRAPTNALARPSARGENPRHDAPESSHAAPTPHPTYTPYESYWSYSVQSPLKHEPTPAQGRESEAGELARNSGLALLPS